MTELPRLIVTISIPAENWLEIVKLGEVKTVSLDKPVQRQDGINPFGILGGGQTRTAGKGDVTYNE